MGDLHPLVPQVRHPSPERAKVSLPLMLAALFLAPVVWTLQILSAYVLAARSCFPTYSPLAGMRVPGMSGWSVAGSLLGLILAGISLWCSTTAWKRTRREKKGGTHEALDVGEGRTRFLALCGIIVTAIFAAAIAFDSLAALLLRQCFNAAA